MKFFFLLLFCFLLVPGSRGQEKAGLQTAAMESLQVERDEGVDADPASRFWRRAPSIYAELDRNGHLLPEFRTEVRSRWTRDNIYFLFVCPYRNLYLKPAPDRVHETYELWRWNVAEVFVGSDFKDIQRYKEFEVSPQNEWIDLDVDLHKPHHEEGWVWNSGFEHTARIDRTNQVWYVAMRIPFTALGVQHAAPGMTFRVNLFRTEGSSETARQIMWQPTMSHTFHVPERFGLLKLVAR